MKISRSACLLLTLLLLQLSSFLTQHASAQEWSVTYLYEEDQALAGASAGELALFAAGSVYRAPVNVYNVSSHNWTSATLSQARKFAHAASPPGFAIFAGGKYQNGTGPSNVVDIYNAANNTWTNATLSSSRLYMGSTSLGSLAFFAGGGPNYASYTATVDIYNTSNNQWSTATLSTARSYLAATSLGDMAIFAGGSNASALNTVDIYHLSNNSWTTATLSQARYNMAATSVGELAIFAGGYLTQIDPVSTVDIFAGGYSIQSDAVSTVDIFNATSGLWTTTSLSSPVSNMAAASVCGSLALFGGGIGSQVTGTVHIYNLTSNSWSTSSLSVARDDIAAASVKGFVLFAGGSNDTRTFSQVDVFTSSCSSANTPSTLSSATPSASASATPSASASATPSASASATPSASASASTPSASPSTISTPTSFIGLNTSQLDLTPALQGDPAGPNMILIPKSYITPSFFDHCLDMLMFPFHFLVFPDEGVLQPNSQVGLSLVVINEFHNRSTVVSKGLVPPMCGSACVHTSLSSTETLLTVSNALGGLCWKQVLGNTLNSIGSLLLSSAIDVSTTEGGPVSAKNQTLLQIQFFLFDRTTTIQLANSSFVIEPYLTKFSIGLFNWPWSQYGNSIEIRFSVQPNFTNYTRQNDSGITTFTIDTATGQIQLRLVDTVELDGQDTNSVQFDLDPGTSELVLTFPYFMSSLVYDPGKLSSRNAWLSLILPFSQTWESYSPSLLRKAVDIFGR